MGEEKLPVLASIQILMLPDGSVKTNVQGQGITYVAVLGMLEVAKANIVARHQEEAKRPKIIQHADPALASQMNGKG